MKISHATRANWQRLKSDPAVKLLRGANKSCSVKKIFPKEYLLNKKTHAWVVEFLSFAEKKSLPRADIICSLAVKLLQKHGIFDKKHVKDVLSTFPGKFAEELPLENLPLEEWDILGFIYQCLLSEGEKNIAGAYYTPCDVAQSMLADRPLADGQNMLDPCCGTGSFLLAVKASTPEQLWGCDLDDTAVFIAKVNLLCRYKQFEFIPHIYNLNYLTASDCHILQKRFDLIATNPPWGAKNNRQLRLNAGNRQDTFASFFYKAYQQLEKGGACCFLLPEAVLNIRAHKELRRFILNECNLTKISFLQGSFSGVMSKYVNIEVVNAPATETVTLVRDGRFVQLDQEELITNFNYTIAFTGPKDKVLLKKIESCRKYDLAKSIFALGIVTGDNKNKLSDICQAGMEAVCTGKEIGRYKLLAPRKYLFYERSQFQQVAKDEYYRAGEKLVYKFISKELVFAYDNTASLLLNSANMLIPKIPQLSIKTILALLNSEVLRYYYKMRFGDMKILKGNLIELPLPHIETAPQRAIEEQIDLILQGRADDDLQKMIYHCYQLTAEEITYIKSCL